MTPVFHSNSSAAITGQSAKTMSIKPSPAESASTRLRRFPALAAADHEVEECSRSGSSRLSWRQSSVSVRIPDSISAAKISGTGALGTTSASTACGVFLLWLQPQRGRQRCAPLVECLLLIAKLRVLVQAVARSSLPERRRCGASGSMANSNRLRTRALRLGSS